MRGSRPNAYSQPLTVYGPCPNVHRKTCALPDPFNAYPRAGPLASTCAHICPRRIDTGRVILMTQALRSRPKLA